MLSSSIGPIYVITIWGTITGLNNSKVNDGNSFAAPWEFFAVPVLGHVHRQ